MFEQQKTTILFSNLRSGFCWSFFSSCLNFFARMQWPLQCNIGLYLFSQSLEAMLDWLA